MPPTSPTPNSDQLPGLDLLKFSMALCVVALHSWLFKNVPSLHAVVHPLYLVAVPVFFTVSSYLFFAKVSRCGAGGGWTVLGHYLKRLGVFYLFWFIVMLPLTIIAKHWHHHFSAAGFFRDLFLASTFRGSWFLAALLFGMPVVFIARKAFGGVPVLFAALALHLAFQPPLIDFFPLLGRIGRYAFPSSMVWMALGAWMADIPWHHGALHSSSHASSSFLRWLALIAVYAAMIAADRWDIVSPCALLMPILRLAFASLVFSLAADCRFGNRALCRKLRQLSILVYVTHFAFAYATAYAREIYPVFGNGFLRFPIVLGGALAVSSAFLFLKDKPRFSWLKWGL